MLGDVFSRRIFDQVKDDTTSLRCLQESGTLSMSTRNSSVLDPGGVSATFDFDREVFSSRAYLNATRSNMIFSMQTRAHGKQTSASNSQLSTSSPRFRIGRTFSLHSFRHQGDSGSLSPTDPMTGANQQLPTLREHEMQSEMQPEDIQIFSRGGMNAQENHFNHRRLRTSIRSTFSGNTSIFRFGQHRHVASSPHHQLSPRQAPQGATKLLLLGCGRSGKTTLIKSLDAAFGRYDAEVRQSYRYEIYDNVIESMKPLIRHGENSLVCIRGMEEEEIFKKNVKIIDECVKNKSLGTSFSQDIASATTTLWNDPSIRSALAEQVNRSLPLLESAE